MEARMLHLMIGAGKLHFLLLGVDAMTQQDTGKRRRADDFKANSEDTSSDTLDPTIERRHSYRKPRRAPGRSFLRRFRQPIIGLSLAGVAAPLVNAGTQPTGRPEPEKGEEPQTGAQPTEAEQARQAAASEHGDTEEVLAAKIAESHHTAKESSFITEAVDKYEISEDLARDIYTIAQEEGIEPKVAFGLVKTESSFKNRAVSHVGARGLTQVMPRTARWMVPGTRAEDLYDQKTNLRFGFRYLNQMIDKYKGNVRLALLAYNRGPGTVDKILRRGGDPNNGYADKVLRG
jgi:hypothetical protein